MCMGVNKMARSFAACQSLFLPGETGKARLMFPALLPK
jgi:hypothetical protein